MVDIEPGQGVSFSQGRASIALGDSLNKVMALLQDSLSIFGTIKLVVPQKQQQNLEQGTGDTWIYLLQSGLKLRFDAAS